MLLNNGDTYEPEQADIIQWEKTYPAINVYQELNAMESWLDANPTRRKTSKGIKRFINSWLTRAQDRGGSPQVKSNANSSKSISIEDKLADVGWIQNESMKQQAKEFYLRTKGFYFDGEQRRDA
jgi:hypothetical protein